MSELTLDEWKKLRKDNAVTQICYRNNMSTSDKTELESILSVFLDDGIAIIKQWRKLKDNDEFLTGKHDYALKQFVIDKYLSNGRDIYKGYSSGGVNATMDQTPEGRLKNSCKQVM